MMNDDDLSSNRSPGSPLRRISSSLRSPLSSNNSSLRSPLRNGGVSVDTTSVSGGIVISSSNNTTNNSTIQEVCNDSNDYIPSCRSLAYTLSYLKSICINDDTKQSLNIFIDNLNKENKQNKQNKQGIHFGYTLQNPFNINNNNNNNNTQPVLFTPGTYASSLPPNILPTNNGAAFLTIRNLYHPHHKLAKRYKEKVKREVRKRQRQRQEKRRKEKREEKRKNTTQHVNINIKSQDKR